MERGGNDSNKEEWFYYGACMKNHAVALGGTTLDGCGEFSPKDDTPDSLFCSVCGCHRNFHKQTLFLYSPDRIEERPPSPPAPPAPVRPEVPPVVQVPSEEVERGQKQQQDQTMVATSTVVAFPAQNAMAEVAEPVVKKRPRTIFTEDQKTKMSAYANDLGWNMVRERSSETDRFCYEIGVSRQSFRVWMHNHKNSSISGPADDAGSRN
ncbi:zinc-finger homeodomain protein 1-like [Macadamia integrifolia]|uniref:zinc-finger homeodomain protein 1-like n=1 Tax=Macadamia integrifolia TaxID=60698 RepID=UPI001C4F0AC0|nr:zinc-finger homeodomain protein 1-like [Macadamia integrifolia]